MRIDILVFHNVVYSLQVVRQLATCVNKTVLHFVLNYATSDACELAKPLMKILEKAIKLRPLNLKYKTKA